MESTTTRPQLTKAKELHRTADAVQAERNRPAPEDIPQAIIDAMWVMANAGQYVLKVDQLTVGQEVTLKGLGYRVDRIAERRPNGKVEIWIRW